MGYSISIPIKFNKDKEKMINFLQEHYRDFGKLIGEENYRLGVSYPTDEVSYPPSKSRASHYVGFDFNTGGLERHYTMTIASWVAIKTGKRKRYLERDVPYLIYDGNRDVVLLIGDGGEEKGSEIPVDENGFFHVMRGSFFYLKERTDEIEGLIQEELQRLNELWEKTKKYESGNMT